MRVLLLGGNGFVGGSIKKFLTKKKISFFAPTSKNLNLKKINQIENFLKKKKNITYNKFCWESGWDFK